MAEPATSAESAPVVSEDTPVAEAVATPAPAETLISAAEDPAPVVEAVAPEAEKTEEAAPAPIAEAAPSPETPAEEKLAEPADSVPEPRVYTDFDLPEGFEASPEQLGSYTTILGKYNLPQEAGQELLDLHGSMLKEAVEHVQAAQQDSFDRMRAGWRADFFKQAGNQRATIANDAKWAIMEAIPDQKTREEFWSALAYTGMGDHPIMLNMLASLAKRVRERPAPAPGLPGNNRDNLSPYDRRYGVARAKN